MIYVRCIIQLCHIRTFQMLYFLCDRKHFLHVNNSASSTSGVVVTQVPSKHLPRFRLPAGANCYLNFFHFHQWYFSANGDWEFYVFPFSIFFFQSFNCVPLLIFVEIRVHFLKLPLLFLLPCSILLLILIQFLYFSKHTPVRLYVEIRVHSMLIFMKLSLHENSLIFSVLQWYPHVVFCCFKPYCIYQHSISSIGMCVSSIQKYTSLSNLLDATMFVRFGYFSHNQYLRGKFL